MKNWFIYSEECTKNDKEQNKTSTQWWARWTINQREKYILLFALVFE